MTDKPQAPDVPTATQRSVGLIEHQRLATSGARTALPLVVEGETYLIVPQLAEDVLGQQRHMNGGNSDVDTLIFRWVGGRFEADGRLPVPGGEDAHRFEIGDETFLAMASIRTGHGPYDMNVNSSIYRRKGGRWALFQEVPAFGARQWLHFSFDGRHFLALAVGVTLPHAEPRNPRHSRILEWDGSRFQDFQALDGGWGYGWEFFELEGERYLGYTDHTSPSLLYRWDGQGFVPFQTFSETTGRAFRFFEHQGRAWLAFAAIEGDSMLYAWSGGRFVSHQRLGGPGGREFAVFRSGERLFLVRICFIEGKPADPKTDLKSQIYSWQGEGLVKELDFPTFGGTDAEPFVVDGQLYLAVANSLTPDVRFRQDSMIYRVETWSA